MSEERHETAEPAWSDEPEETDRGTWILPCGHEVWDKDQNHYCDYINLIPLRHRLEGTLPTAGILTRPHLHPDEVLFITVHAAVEHFFSQMIFEVRRVIALIATEDAEAIRTLVQRIRSLSKLANETQQLLFKRFTTESFGQFRAHITPASGAESIQYRVIEILLGYREDTPHVETRGQAYTYREFLDRAPGPEDNDPKTRWWVPQLEPIMQEPCVRGELMALLERKGTSIRAVAMSREHELRLLVRSLFYLCKCLTTFRTGHVETARHHIGERPGTGHTTGVQYLRSVIRHPLFPEFEEHAHEFERRTTTW